MKRYIKYQKGDVIELKKSILAKDTGMDFLPPNTPVLGKGTYVVEFFDSDGETALWEVVNGKLGYVWDPNAGDVADNRQNITVKNVKYSGPYKKGAKF